jgi:chaperonin GroES
MAKTKFRPLHDRVVVRRIAAEEKTKGGIIIPDTAQEKPQEGEVIAVGPGGRDENGKLIPIDLKAGNRVLFGKWSGTEVKLDGEELLIMKESDIMGRDRLTPYTVPFCSRSDLKWLPRTSNFPAMPANGCCAVSIFSPTPSRSRSVRKAAMSSSTNRSAPRASPRTA